MDGIFLTKLWKSNRFLYEYVTEMIFVVTFASASVSVHVNFSEMNIIREVPVEVSNKMPWTSKPNYVTHTDLCSIYLFFCRGCELPKQGYRNLHRYGKYLCHVHGLVPDCKNSIANALELLQSYTKPSLYTLNVSHHCLFPKLLALLSRLLWFQVPLFWNFVIIDLKTNIKWDLTIWHVKCFKSLVTFSKSFSIRGLGKR